MTAPDEKARPQLSPFWKGFFDGVQLTMPWTIGIAVAGFIWCSLKIMGWL